MNSLFPIEDQYPEGFAYYSGFISENEEEELLKAISGIERHNMLFQGYEAKRKVASFGYDWSFEKRTLSKGKEIPHVFNDLIKKVSEHLQIAQNNFAELLITEYPVGSVINWHRDAPPFDTIVGISFLSDCVFKFRPYDKSKQKRSAIISLPLQRRSLYVMKDASRTEWEHSIAPVQQVRYSITLRTLRTGIALK